MAGGSSFARRLPPPERIQRTTISPPTNRMITPWMIVARLIASSARVRSRCCSRRCGARRRAAHRARCRGPCCVPSSATAMPVKPASTTCRFVVWIWNEPEPSTSAAPARPAKAPAIAIESTIERLTETPAVARRLGVQPDRAHLVAEGRAREDQRVDDRGTERDEDRDRDARAGDEAPDRVVRRREWQRARDGRARARVLQRSAEAEEPLAAEDRDPVQHDRRDDLVRAAIRLEEARDRRPGRAHQGRAEVARNTASRPWPCQWSVT